MKDHVLRIEYFSLTTDDRPAVGAELAKRLAKENVNLLGLLVLPSQPGKVQVDLVPVNPDAFMRAARRLGLTTSMPKLAFLMQSIDRPTAIFDLLDRLGGSSINVRSLIALSTGGNRYGAIVFVDPDSIEETTRVLEANVIAHHI